MTKEVMHMARRTTEDILNHADELATMFETSFEPTSTEVTDPLDGLRAAVVAEANARKNVEVWVANARGAKLAWTAIGGALGTTGEAARQRFGPPLGEPVPVKSAAKKAPAKKAPAKKAPARKGVAPSGLAAKFPAAKKSTRQRDASSAAFRGSDHPKGSRIDERR